MAELTKLGRYQITKVLGRGAMGVVYEGLDPRLNRRVAIKTILKNAAIDEETAQMYSAQFQREAQAAGRLNHPNIVHVHDFAEEGDIAYLVMEYIQGRELRGYFEAKERFDVAEAVRIMGELLDALHYAHEAGIIHRDVKPANVMLDAEKRVKLADFGVARIQDSERSAAGTMVGTPAFMSPEQIQGQKIDRRTDIFSAGVVLYQLLTGEQPFTGAGAWTVAKKIMQDEPPRPSSVVKSVSPAFDAIVNKALAKKPADRYATAREFATDLRAALGGAQPSATASLPPAGVPRARAGAQASEAEVEFWKAIQNSTDAAEFEFYLEQFPEGTYAALARHKIARLTAKAPPPGDDTVRLQAEAAEKQRREAEAKALQEKAEAEARERWAAAEKAQREAEEKAKREAEARRAAEEKARQAAEEARRIAQAKAEAEARAKRVAEELAQRQAAEKAQREAAEQAKRAASEQAKRAADERARQAAALARLKQEEQARKSAAPDPEATVAIPKPAPRAVAPAAPAAPVEEKKRSFLVPALIGAALLVAGAGAFFALSPKPAPQPVAQAPKAEVTAAEIEKIRKETEERVRKEFADKSAAEQAAAAKAAAEKAVQEKLAAAEKAAADKAAADKALAAKAAAERVAHEKAAAERAAVEKAAAAKASAEKAAAERAALERAAAEKAAAEKAAAEKAAAEKAAAEKLAAAKAAAAAAGPSQEELLQKFVQRHGQGKVVPKEPPNAIGALGRGETIYVNDGSCPRGQIKKVVGGDNLRGTSREYACIALADDRPSSARPASPGSAATAEKAATEKPAESDDSAKMQAAIEKALAQKPAPAGPSHEELLQKFIQRHGKDSVVSKEPPFVMGALPWGQKIYVNDGRCVPGTIMEVTGGDFQRGTPRSRRCIALTD